MPKPQTLAGFYLTKIHWLPENLRQNIGHFNVFRLDDFVGLEAVKIPYSRKDFYKITLVSGNSNYHFADKTIALRGHALFFANPLMHCRPAGAAGAHPAQTHDLERGRN